MPKRKNWIESTVTGKYGFRYCPVCAEYFDRPIPDRQGVPDCWDELNNGSYTRHVKIRTKRTDARPVRLNRTYTARPI